MRNIPRKSLLVQGNNAALHEHERNTMKRTLLFAIVSVFLLFAASGRAEKLGEIGEYAKGLSEIKDASRNHPGWECPHHPLLKTFLPMDCPICRQMGKGIVLYERKGEWTCLEHPEVSSSNPGRCPLCTAELITIQELEERTGKTIFEIDKAIMAELRKTTAERLREYELARKTKIHTPPVERKAETGGTQGGPVRLVSVFISFGLVAMVAIAVLLFIKRRRERQP